MLVAREIAATPNLHRNRQFVAVQRARVLTWLWPCLSLPGILLRVFRINVNQLDDEVSVGARRSSEELRCDFASNSQIFFKRRTGKCQHMRAAIDETLVCDFPSLPITGRIGRS